MDAATLLLTGSHTAVIIQAPADNSIYLAIVTAALVVATIYLAFVTRSHVKHTAIIVEETCNTVKEMRRATDLQILPSLIITFNTTIERNLTLDIKNTGRGLAKQIHP
jgi:hypothetical protein